MKLMLTKRRRGDRGFTLLEVMITLAILASALTLVARSQQASMRAVGRGRQITVATALARGMLTDFEDDLFEDGFPELDDDEEGDFEEQGYPEYRYRLAVEKIELPSNVNASTLNEAISGGSEGEEGAGVTGAMAAGAGLIGQQFEIFRRVLEASVRRVRLEVFWNEGSRERSVDVTTYFTDPRQVDIAMGAGGTGFPGAGLPGTSSSTGGDKNGGGK